MSHLGAAHIVHVDYMLRLARVDQDEEQRVDSSHSREIVSARPNRFYSTPSQALDRKSGIHGDHSACRLPETAESDHRRNCTHLWKHDVRVGTRWCDGGC